MTSRCLVPDTKLHCVSSSFTGSHRILYSKMRINRLLLLIVGACLLCGPVQMARAQELPPDVRATLFVPTAVVTIPQDIVRIPMRGTDWQGNHKCPYFRVF